ncbi:MAG: ASKHA domain-containing protein [Anaerolineaceae bacterium]|nr:ASKHA domain-containing protein [Anaerolineaceae bacterium]
MNIPQHIELTIEPSGRRVTLPAGANLLQAAREAGLSVNAVCGGNGTCGSCKVKLISGDFSPITPKETAMRQNGSLPADERLACLTTALSDGKIHFKPESLASAQRLQLEGELNPITINLAVKRLDIDLSTDFSGQKLSAAESVRETLKINGYLHTDLPDALLPRLTQLLEEHSQKAALVLNGHQLVTALPPDQHMLGLAVDLGTTKLAAFLVDLETGQTLASGGALNPQVAYGEDVISRIQFADEHQDGAATLQKAVVEGLNNLAAELTAKVGLPPAAIVDGVIAGNTAMHHLLAGLPVHNLGTAPYHPSQVEAMVFAASEIGLKLADNAFIYLPPNIAGFVGGDHIAMLLATRARHTLKTVLALDIGTNTEISLLHKGRHLACSCASGPAFEGAHIRSGLRAIPGAIERVFIEGSEVKLQTIEDQPAVGICGSGILDAVAELRRNDLIDHRGAFNKQDERLVMRDGQPEFVLVPAAHSATQHAISLNRQDVQEIQLAKAAIRSGIEVLLREADCSAEEIDLFLVAGAFGTYLDLTNCQRIGMFPELALKRFKQVGNAAGSGARELLLSTDKRREAESMLEKIEYIELTTVKDYVEFYMDAIGL